MTYDEFNAFCRALPATTHVVQWGGAQVWKVGGKLFAIGGWADDGPAYTFKAGRSPMRCCRIGRACVRHLISLRAV